MSASSMSCLAKFMSPVMIQFFLWPCDDARASCKVTNMHSRLKECEFIFGRVSLDEFVWQL